MHMCNVFFYNTIYDSIYLYYMVYSIYIYVYITEGPAVTGVVFFVVPVVN